MKPATALIAEDEPLLAQALQSALSQAWPQLLICAVASNGLMAAQLALEHRPDIVFLDVRMPGQSGLDVAAEIAEEWPHGQPLPLIVFVTAYDEYAVRAFESQALDYLLKPVTPDRLAMTVQRLQQALARRQPDAPRHDAAWLDQLRTLMGATAAAAEGTPALTVVQASVGSTIRLVPIEEVLVFEAADKYVRVLTASQDLLIRTPLRDLLPQLDARQFWQIHRGTVVRATAIDTVTRDDAGRQYLQVRGRPERWPVSRLHAGRFRAM